MKKMQLLLLLSVFTCLHLNTKAQDDSAFAQIYRKMREITDGLKTYHFYLTAFNQPSRQIRLSKSHQQQLLSVFHFLKEGKELSAKDPDIVINIMVENLRLLNPGGSGPGLVTRTANGDGYTETATSTFTFTLWVYTKKQKSIQYRFYHPVAVYKTIYERPLHSFNDIIRDSLSRHGYSLSGTTQSTSSFVRSDLLPSQEDYKYELTKLLERYKNRYVDRVYN